MSLDTATGSSGSPALCRPCAPARALALCHAHAPLSFYLDFFYYYAKSWKNNEKLKLPA